MSAATKQKPATLSLYEIGSEYRQMADKLRQLDIDDETLADTLESESGDLIDKLCAVVAVSLSMDAEAEQIEVYVLKRAADRMQALQKRASRLREYALDTMRACNVGTGKEAVGQPDLRFRVKPNPEKVEITDESLIPELFMRTPEPPPPPKPAPDKKAILAALKEDKAVAGCKLTRSYKLDIQ